MLRKSAEDLKHVLWLAGSPGAGKSTVSHLLAQIYVMVDYHVDAWALAHLQRRISRGDVEAQAFFRKSMDERWLVPTADDLARSAQRSWMQEFELVIEDLRMLPRENLIMAEGNFFPEAVVPYLTHPNQALWLIPTPEFCRRARQQKQARLRVRQQRHGVYDEGSQPEKRLEQLIARDIRLAEEVRRQAVEHGTAFIEVAGSRSIDESLATVEDFYDPFLKHYYTTR